MGLAASQGRYLCLTARMSDLVYEGQQISQQRMNLAKESQAIADRYAEATNNKIMVANVYTGGAEASTQQQLTYSLLTSPTSEYGLGYRLVDKYGNVVVPSNSDYLEASELGLDGQRTTTKFFNQNDFISKYMPDLSEEDKASYSTYSMAELKNKFNELNPDSGVTLETKKSFPEHIMQDNDARCVDENVMDPEYLHMMITTGEYYIQAIENPEKPEWKEISWQGSNHITEVYDTSDDAAAEAQYEADMRALEKKDKILELRLEQVETEEKSVETEIETVKGVIDKNIENSFKTFA